MESLQFVKLNESLIGELAPMMKRAFDEDSRIHLGTPTGGPPGYDDGSFLRKYGLSKNATSYAVFESGVLVGGVILFIKDNGMNFLGNMFVDSQHSNKGLGTLIWRHVEQMFPSTKTWFTETPIFAHRNHNFYINKCGFSCYKIKDPHNLKEGQFLLKKEMR